MEEWLTEISEVCPGCGKSSKEPFNSIFGFCEDCNREFQPMVKQLRGKFIKDKKMGFVKKALEEDPNNGKHPATSNASR